MNGNAVDCLLDSNEVVNWTKSIFVNQTSTSNVVLHNNSLKTDDLAPVHKSGSRPAGAPVRSGRAKKVLNFNNDLTNMVSCVSPFHPNAHDPFSEEVLSGAVAETAGLGVQTHLLAPGLCWVAWWQSKLSPPRAHDAWIRSTFGNVTHLSPAQTVFQFVLDGGDIMGDFIKHARAHGERAAVSFRINDFQSCEQAPSTKSYGFLSQFWYEHRHDPDVMYKGSFNDSCCWEKKCECSCYGGQASMALSNALVLANRRGFMLELLALYPGVDFEIDLERWSMIFRPTSTNSSHRHALMTSLLRDLRQAMSPGSRLGLRVPPNLEVLDQLGVDLAALAVDPSIRLDYATLGVSFFAFLASTTDFEKIRKQAPALQLLFELSELHEYYTLTKPSTEYGNSTRVQQLLTAEQLTTVALDAYAMGADGISTFNFQYYRTAGLEPLYDVLPHLTDESYLQSADQYYFWTGHDSPPLQCTVDGLPFALSGQANKTLRVRITPPSGDSSHYEALGLLRFKFGVTANYSGVMDVRVNGGEPLRVSLNTSRIFQSPVRDIDEGKYAAYHVPTNLLQAGLNEVAVSCQSTLCNTHGEPGYTLSHDAGPAGDGRRWRFPRGYEPNSQVNGSAHPGASLPECEKLCDADLACVGVYHDSSSVHVSTSCFVLHELIVDGHTELSGQSYERVRGSQQLRVGNSVGTIEAMDLMLPVFRP